MENRNFCETQTFEKSVKHKPPVNDIGANSSL